MGKVASQRIVVQWCDLRVGMKVLHLPTNRYAHVVAALPNKVPRNEVLVHFDDASEVFRTIPRNELSRIDN